MVMAPPAPTIGISSRSIVKQHHMERLEQIREATNRAPEPASLPGPMFNMRSRQLLFAIPLVSASCSKKLSVVNEEMIVARPFLGFLYGRKRWGQTSIGPIDWRIKAIQEASQHLPLLSSTPTYVELEAMDQRSISTGFEVGVAIVETVPLERCEPPCESTVTALYSRTLLVQSATLRSATAARMLSQLEDRVNPVSQSMG